MPEKLSQSQIDLLLQKFNSNEEVAPEAKKDNKIKEYDFRSPKKFTKEQLRAMDSLHENFSRMLSSYLSGLLRVFCEVTVLQIEEQRYYEYNNALPDTTLIGLLDLKPTEKKYSEGTLIMDMSTSVVFSMIDRLLGGSGSGSEMLRDFTEIELAIINNLLEKICARLRDAWCNYIDVDVGIRSIETNARLLQALPPEDTVVIVLLNVKIKNLQGNISICIPAVNLEEMIDNFSQRYTRAYKRQDPEVEKLKKQVILETLTESDLEIKAVLHEFSLDLRDIVQLQVDDVIPLSKNINSDIKVIVDDTPWFNAKMGETKQKKAVKLSDMTA